jgi:ribosome assembly protein 4
MATIVPPPSKRQQTAINAISRVQVQPQPPPAGSIRIRIHDRSTNKPLGQSLVSVPLADASVKNLGLLVNSLNDTADPADRVPYQFFYLRQKGGNDDSATQELSLADTADIYSALIKPGYVTTEDELILHVSPQAVFKVKAVSRCSSSMSGHGQPVLTAQFSPATSSRLCTGSGDSAATIWDTDTGTPVKKLSGHTGWVLCVSYSPDGSMVATGSYDKNILLWTAEGKSQGRPLKGHTGFIRSLVCAGFHWHIQSIQTN